MSEKKNITRPNNQVLPPLGERGLVIIIGGGAAGYFTAINAKENNPELDITNTVLEELNKRYAESKNK